MLAHVYAEKYMKNELNNSACLWKAPQCKIQIECITYYFFLLMVKIFIMKLWIDITIWFALFVPKCVSFFCFTGACHVIIFYAN